MHACVAIQAGSARLSSKAPQRCGAAIVASVSATSGHCHTAVMPRLLAPGCRPLGILVRSTNSLFRLRLHILCTAGIVFVSLFVYTRHRYLCEYPVAIRRSFLSAATWAITTSRDSTSQLWSLKAWLARQHTSGCVLFAAYPFSELNADVGGQLTREYKTISENPPPYITAHPSEANILECVPTLSSATHRTLR